MASTKKKTTTSHTQGILVRDRTIYVCTTDKCGCIGVACMCCIESQIKCIYIISKGLVATFFFGKSDEREWWIKLDPKAHNGNGRLGGCIVGEFPCSVRLSECIVMWSCGMALLFVVSLGKKEKRKSPRFFALTSPQSLHVLCVSCHFLLHCHNFPLG